MTSNRQVEHRITLEYIDAEDDPERQTYRRFPISPEHSAELVVAIRDHPDLDIPDVYPENPSQLQVHVVGTARALEELGRYLIALARLDTKNPEPSESIDDVRNADGGTIRLIPRRVDRPLPRKERDEGYAAGFR